MWTENLDIAIQQAEIENEIEATPIRDFDCNDNHCFSWKTKYIDGSDIAANDSEENSFLR